MVPCMAFRILHKQHRITGADHQSYPTNRDPCDTGAVGGGHAVRPLVHAFGCELKERSHGSPLDPG